MRDRLLHFANQNNINIISTKEAEEITKPFEPEPFLIKNYQLENVMYEQVDDGKRLSKRAERRKAQRDKKKF